jgi:hypothetical protein
MEQIAVVARLKDGARIAAAALLAGGPPFDPVAHGLTRHEVYLTPDEVVFVFEGHDVEWIVDALVDEPLNWPLSQALDAWRELVELPPYLARAEFAWRAPSAAAAV